MVFSIAHIKSYLKLAVTCAIVVIAAPILAQSRAVITFSALTLAVGETGTIEAYVDCGSIVCTVFDIQIEYDPSLVQVDGLELGSYLGDGAITLQSDFTDSGVLRLSATALGMPHLIVDDPLFTIDVTAIAVGQMQLTVSDLQIGDSEPLPASIHGGIIQVTPPEISSSVAPSATANPIVAPSATEAVTMTCPGALPSRLVAGEQGQVTPGAANSLRDAPSVDSNRVGQIPAGAAVRILAGPECRGGYAWWQVNYNGSIGWTVEGDENSYWLSPIGTADASAEQVHAALPASSLNSNLSGWTIRGDGGTWSAGNAGLVAGADRGVDSFYVAENNYADFNYEVTFTITAGAAPAAAGVIFRSQPDPLQGSYMVRVSAYSGGEISLTKFFPVRQYQQLARRNLPISLHSTYTLRVTAVGTQISIYLNGQLVLQSSDSSYQQGAVGLNVNSSTTLFTSANVENR